MLNVRKFLTVLILKVLIKICYKLLYSNLPLIIKLIMLLMTSLKYAIYSSVFLFLRQLLSNIIFHDKYLFPFSLTLDT